MATEINTSSDSGVVEVCTSGQPREFENDTTIGEGELKFVFITLTIS